MRIEIHTDEQTTKTSVKIDGAEVGGFLNGYTLKHEAGYVPELELRITCTGDIDIELPDGVVTAKVENIEE